MQAMFEATRGTFFLTRCFTTSTNNYGGHLYAPCNKRQRVFCSRANWTRHAFTYPKRDGLWRHSLYSPARWPQTSPGSSLFGYQTLSCRCCCRCRCHRRRYWSDRRKSASAHSVLGCRLRELRDTRRFRRVPFSRGSPRCFFLGVADTFNLG